MNMVEIKCLRCKEEFQIGKEQLLKIREIAIGIVKPKDYLRFFPLISSECKDGKGHDFIFTDKFSDLKKEVIQTFDAENKSIVELKKELDSIDNMNGKLKEEKEQINKRLEEIRDVEFANDQKTNDITLVKIPDKESMIVKTLDSFEELVGTRDIDKWR